MEIPFDGLGPAIQQADPAHAICRLTACTLSKIASIYGISSSSLLAFTIHFLSKTPIIPHQSIKHQQGDGTALKSVDFLTAETSRPSSPLDP